MFDSFYQGLNQKHHTFKRGLRKTSKFVSLHQKPVCPKLSENPIFFSRFLNSYRSSTRQSKFSIHLSIEYNKIVADVSIKSQGL